MEFLQELTREIMISTVGTLTVVIGKALVEQIKNRKK